MPNSAVALPTRPTSANIENQNGGQQTEVEITLELKEMCALHRVGCRLARKSDVII